MMKKSLVLLPLLSALALVGCGKKDDQGNQGNQEELIDKAGPAQVGDFKRVDNPVVGKSYVFGFYLPEDEEVRFATGNYHSDSKGQYPYYMATKSTSSADDLDELAKFTFEDAGNGQYKIKVTCEDTEKPWHDMYVAVYAATSTYSNNVFSFAPVEDINQQYQPVDKTLSPEGELVDVIGKFDFVKNGEGCKLNTIGFTAAHFNEPDDEKFRTFGCQYQDYVSIDCSAIDKAISDDYSVAHFYEVE